MTIHDITVTIAAGSTPVWPGDPMIERTLVWQMGTQSAANVSRLSMSAHTGTHVDAPVHFIAGGAASDALDLTVLVGQCHVCDAKPDGRTIRASDLAALHLPAGVERLLLRTANSALWAQFGGAFQHDFVTLSPDAARWLVQRGIRLVGIDYLSVEAFDCAEPIVHRTLLGAGVVVLEGIDLSGITPGQYMLVCLPMKLADSDGAPARAILIDE